MAFTARSTTRILGNLSLRTQSRLPIQILAACRPANLNQQLHSLGQKRAVDLIGEEENDVGLGPVERCDPDGNPGCDFQVGTGERWRQADYRKCGTSRAHGSGAAVLFESPPPRIAEPDRRSAALHRRSPQTDARSCGMDARPPLSPVPPIAVRRSPKSSHSPTLRVRHPSVQPRPRVRAVQAEQRDRDLERPAGLGNHLVAALHRARRR